MGMFFLGVFVTLIVVWWALGLFVEIEPQKSNNKLTTKEVADFERLEGI